MTFIRFKKIFKIKDKIQNLHYIIISILIISINKLKNSLLKINH